MKYAPICLLLLVLTGFVVMATTQVRAAEDTTVLTQKQIDNIVDTCADSRYELEQLHASDALIRVNIGQEYDNLSSRLMAPLNSRIALNGLDGVELSRVTVEYNDAVKAFQQRYLTYEASMSAAIKTDCKNDPVGYYSHIKNARRLRADVGDAARDIKKLIGEYRREFERFAKTTLEEAK